MLISGGLWSQGTCIGGQCNCAVQQGAWVHTGASGLIGRPEVRLLESVASVRLTSLEVSAAELGVNKSCWDHISKGMVPFPQHTR